MRPALPCLAAVFLTAVASAQDGVSPVSGYDFMAPPTQELQDDDFLNPGFFLVERGRALWEKAERGSGQSCASCHGDAAVSMRGVAARYPVHDPVAGGLVNLENRINGERETRLDLPPLPYESEALLALTAFLSLQSRGLPMDVATDGPALAHWERGRDYYMTRRGQLNLACNHCHDERPGERLRGDVLSQGQINAFPVWRLLWSGPGSRHRMFQWCNISLRADPAPLGSEAYLDLELYVASRGNGLPMEAPGVRR